jgi:hypothetical protein
VQFKAEALANRDNMIDLIVTEILRGYNHKSDDHLEEDEMFTLVKEIMPEIDKNFRANDSEIMAAIQTFDMDGDHTYDKSEVENFIKLMMEHGWTEGLKISKAKMSVGDGGRETLHDSNVDLDFQDSNYNTNHGQKKVSFRESRVNPMKSARGDELKAKLRFMKQSMDAMTLLLDEYMDEDSEGGNLRGSDGDKSLALD